MRWWFLWWCLHDTSSIKEVPLSSVKPPISPSVKPPISHIDENSTFPRFIPHYEVRRDAHNVMVTRGDLEKRLSTDTGVIDFANDFELKNIGKMKKRVSYAQLESAYQVVALYTSVSPPRGLNDMTPFLS